MRKKEGGVVAEGGGRACALGEGSRVWLSDRSRSVGRRNRTVTVACDGARFSEGGVGRWAKWRMAGWLR